MIGFPKSEENLDANEHGYHIFGQNIKYQHEQKVMINKKYLHTVNPKQPILAYTSSVGEIGMISESFYRSGNNGAFQGLFFKFEKYNKSHMLYIMCTLKKQFKYFGYATGMADILSLSFDLPIDKSGEIAFDYMEAYIKELEAERIKELEAYLVATGLNDYVLSDDEKKLIADFRNGRVKWGEFTISELFNIKPTKNYGLSNNELMSIAGHNPVVSNTSLNNGIIGYVGRSTTEKGNMVTFSDTTTDEAIFYQPDSFVGYSHIQGMYPKFDLEQWTKNPYLFFVTVFRQSVKGKYNYGSKFNRENARKEIVRIPVKLNRQPDYDLMSGYIRAIEKMVIKGVVKWKDKQIEATRKIVSKNDIN